MRSSRKFGCLLLLFSPAVIYGQTADAADSKELIRALLNRIDQLEKRVADLESHSATAAAPAPQNAPAVPNPPAPQDQLAVVQPPPEQAPEAPPQPAPPPRMTGEHPGMTGVMPAMHLQGFSDFNFSATDQPHTHSGFSEGQFVLHVYSQLSQKVSYFGELSFTARTDAGLGSPPAPGFNAEVERSIIRFDENDYFKVSFGRYHTPINWWNMTFHHGAWLQTTVSRPEMVQFGGSFLPIHFVGALVEGAFPANGLNLNYNIGIGNGRSSVINRSGDWGDINNNRAWLVTVFSRPSRLYGFQVGGSVYRDLITPALSNKAYREWIESGHIVWQKENPEIIAEFSNVTHQQVDTSLISNSQAWYVQMAYRLPWFERLWKPYYRFEYIHIPLSDPLFRLVPTLAGSTVGVRYDISSFAALKFEWRNQRRPGDLRVNGVFAQTSFTF